MSMQQSTECIESIKIQSIQLFVRILSTQQNIQLLMSRSGTQQFLSAHNFFLFLSQAQKHQLSQEYFLLSGSLIESIVIRKANFLAYICICHIQRIYYKQILSNNTYIFYQSLVVMNKRSLKLKRVHNQSKQNIIENGHAIIHPESKRKIIKKAEHQLHIPQENQRPKNPQQLRHLCQQQEKLVLAQYRSNRLFHHDEFYEHVKNQLAHSKICAKIMMIKAMSNEEAVEELMRIQEIRGKYGSFNYNFSTGDLKDEEDEEEVKTVFKQCAKKTSMIEENDDLYLEDLGVHMDQIDQNFQEEQREKQQPKILTYSNYSQHQYYQNDDVFEF